MNYKRLVTAAATAAMMLQSALPAFAVTDLTIWRNGAGTENEIDYDQSSTTFVSQSNTTSVNNDITVHSNTGGNSVSDSTGGDVYIETGNTTTDVDVVNELNSNVLMMEACGDCEEDVVVDVSKNGADSDNSVELADESWTVVAQDNQAHIDNEVDTKSVTGRNSADDNTGGDITVVTGDVGVDVDVTNTANANSAQVSAGGEGDGEIDLHIYRNGVDTENKIKLEVENGVALTQTNATSLDNLLDLLGKTGGNSADDNTGGIVGIGTGDVDIDVEVTNTAGFNQADLDACNCATVDVHGGISKNGADSDSTIEAELESVMVVEQENTCGRYRPTLLGLFSLRRRHRDRDCFDNQIELTAKTGWNSIDGSTGEADGDPLIITGNSHVFATVHNLGGSNYFTGF